MGRSSSIADDHRQQTHGTLHREPFSLKQDVLNSMDHHSVWGEAAAAKSTISEPIIQQQQQQQGLASRRVTRSLAREVRASLSPHPRLFGSENQMTSASARTYSGNPISPAAARQKYQQKKSVTSTPSRSCSRAISGFDERPAAFSCPSSPYDGRYRGGADRDPEEVEGGSGGCSSQDRALTPESVGMIGEASFSSGCTRSERARRAETARGSMMGGAGGGGGGGGEASFSSSPVRVCRSISFDWTKDRALVDSDEEEYAARRCAGNIIKELGVVSSKPVSSPPDECITRQQRRQHRRAPSCGGDFEIAGTEPAHWNEQGATDFLGGLRSVDALSRSMYRQRQSSFSAVRSSAPMFATPAAADVVGSACSSPSSLRSDNPGYGGQSFIDWLKKDGSLTQIDSAAPVSSDGVVGGRGVPFSGFFTSKRRLQLDDDIKNDTLEEEEEEEVFKGEMVDDGRHRHRAPGYGGWGSGRIAQSRLLKDEDEEDDDDHQMGDTTTSPSTDYVGKQKNRKGGRKLSNVLSTWMGWMEKRHCYSMADMEATWRFVLAGVPFRRGLLVDRALHLCLMALIAVVLGVIMGPGSMHLLPNLEKAGTHHRSSMSGNAIAKPPKDTNNPLLALSTNPPEEGDGTTSAALSGEEMERSQQSSILWWEKDDAVEIRRMWFEQQSFLPDPFAETPVTYLYSSAFVPGERKEEEEELHWDDHSSNHGRGEDNDEGNFAHRNLDDEDLGKGNFAPVDLDDVELIYSVDMAEEANGPSDYEHPRDTVTVRENCLSTDRSVTGVESPSQPPSPSQPQDFPLEERERSPSHDDDGRDHDDDDDERYLVSNNGGENEGGAYLLSSSSSSSRSMSQIARPSKDADQILISAGEDDDIVLVPSSSMIEQKESIATSSLTRREESGQAYGPDDSSGSEEGISSSAKLASMRTPEVSSVTDDGMQTPEASSPNAGDDEDKDTVVGVIELDSDGWESSAAFAAASAAAEYDYDAAAAAAATAAVVNWEEEAFHYSSVEEEEIGGRWISSGFVRKLDAVEIDRLGLRSTSLASSSSVEALSDEYLLVSEEEMLLVDHEEDELVDWVSIWTVDRLGVRDDARSGSDVSTSPDGFGSGYPFGGEEGEEGTYGISDVSGNERAVPLIGRRYRDTDTDLTQTYPSGLWGDVATWTLTASLSLVLLIWGIANGSPDTKLMKLVMTEEEEERGRRSRGRHSKEKERSSVPPRDSAVSAPNARDQFRDAPVMKKESGGQSSVTLSSNLPSSEHSTASSDDVMMMNTGEVTSRCTFQKKKSCSFSKQDSAALLDACGLNSVSTSFMVEQ